MFAFTLPISSFPSVEIIERACQQRTLLFISSGEMFSSQNDVLPLVVGSVVCPPIRHWYTRRGDAVRNEEGRNATGKETNLEKPSRAIDVREAERAWVSTDFLANDTDSSRFSTGSKIH